MKRLRDMQRLSVDGAGIIPYNEFTNIEQKMSDILTPADFGIIGGGVIDETTKLQAAANASAATGKPFLMPASIKHGAITVPAGASLIGVDGKTTVTAITGTYTLYNVTGSDATLKNLMLQCASKSGGSEINIACGTGEIERTELKNIICFLGTGGLTDSGSGSGKHFNTNIDFVQFRMHRGRGMSWMRGFAYLYPTKFTADYNGTTTVADAIYCDFSTVPGSDAGGIFFTDCDVLGVPSVQRAFVIRHAKEVEFTRCRADGVGGDGFWLEVVNKLGLNTTSASLIGGHGYYLKGVTNFGGSDIKGNGRNYLGLSPANKDGIIFDGDCADGLLQGVKMRDFTRHGVNKAGAQAGPIRINGLYAALNTGRGIETTGNSAFVVADPTLVGNMGGNFSLGGNTDYITNGQFNSGGVGSYGPGPVSA